MTVHVSGSWSDEWPTEPGRYLFYGYYTNSQDKFLRLSLVEARMAGTEPNKWLCLSGGGTFFFEGEQKGKWLRIQVDLPVVG